jgi:tol-pal system-associated acyl-CoA thioesterase
MSEHRSQYTHRVRVGYIDTDQGGIVHHSVYLRWLEQARVELMRVNGLDHTTIGYDTEFSLPVARVQLRYLRPAHFDEELDVQCTLAKVGRASLQFDYRVVRGDMLLTQAEVTLACVNVKTGRVARTPEAFRKIVEE